MTSGLIGLEGFGNDLIADDVSIALAYVASPLTTTTTSRAFISIFDSETTGLTQTLDIESRLKGSNVFNTQISAKQFVIRLGLTAKYLIANVTMSGDDFYSVLIWNRNEGVFTENPFILQGGISSFGDTWTRPFDPHSIKTQCRRPGFHFINPFLKTSSVG